MKNGKQLEQIKVSEEQLRETRHQLSLATISLIRMSADHQERMDRLESLMASLPKAVKREIGFSGEETQ